MRFIYVSILLFFLTACSQSDLNLEEELERLKGENDEIVNQVKILNHEIELLIEGNTAALKEVDQLISVNQQLQADNEELQYDKNELQTENERLQNQLVNFKDDPIIPEDPPQLSEEDMILNKANEVILLLEAEDMLPLSSYVHPNNGVRFSPYLYVNVNTDLVFTSNQMIGFLTDNNVYTWGNYDGSGDPIQLTPADYYNAFVYSADFANPEQISYNQILGTGNMIQNQFSVYPNANIVEFYFSGFDPQFEGIDWQSLRLVFEEYNGEWYLVGIIKGSWTI